MTSKPTSRVGIAAGPPDQKQARIDITMNIEQPNRQTTRVAPSP
jgi:hypothetical protein